VIFKIKNNISWYLKACRRCAFAPLRVFAGPEDVISPFCKKDIICCSRIGPDIRRLEG